MNTQRWVVRGVVAALHLALLAALWLHKPAALNERGDRRLTTVRLILPAPRPTPPLPTPLPTPAPRVPTPDPALIAPPAFTTDAAPAVATNPAATAPAPEASPTEAPRSTLRLTLPPGYAASTAAARNPALSDPRSNTVRPTFEERIADAAAQTGEWSMERTSDHRTLLRRGDTCVEVLRSRIDDMDAFNGNVAPRTVKMVGKPYKCK